MSDLISRDDVVAEIDLRRNLLNSQTVALDIAREDAVYAICADAILALPAYEVGVKSLDWVGDETDGHDLIAKPDPYHTYIVRKLGDNRFDVILNHELGSMWFKQRKNEIWPDYASAKAAAQADYTASILSALTTTPAQDVAWLVEAAQRIGAWCAKNVQPNSEMDTALRELDAAITRMKEAGE